jgi:hypothetical protein
MLYFQRRHVHSRSGLRSLNLSQRLPSQTQTNITYILSKYFVLFAKYH